MLEEKLKNEIKKLWDKFWSGGISNPLTAIEQISYLLFIKRLEDEDKNNRDNARFTGEEYQSIFDGDLQLSTGQVINRGKCRWSYISYLQPQGTEENLGLLDHMKQVVFPFIQNLSSEESSYSVYMKDAVFEIPTTSLLQQAISIINDLDIRSQNRDTKGDLYEYLLSELQTAGKNGQFRTPRHIIKMIIELTKPDKGKRILDPACGTGGFLVNAYEYILKSYTSDDLIKLDDEGEEYNFLADKFSDAERKELNGDIYGYDIDTTMTRLGLMNLMMHGIDNPKLQKIDALSQDTPIDKFDVILANPPFKGSVDANELSNDISLKSKKTELLFLDLIMNNLSMGGVAGVIIPEGVLFGTSKAHKELRKRLLEKNRLDAVISMPSGVFKPYAGVSTSVLIFTKGEATQTVHFFEMKADGYSLDDKRAKLDGKGDIPTIIKNFEGREGKGFNDRKKNCFAVSLEEIVKNDFVLNLSHYKEEEIEEEKHRPIEEIKKDILDLEKEIQELLSSKIFE